MRKIYFFFMACLFCAQLTTAQPSSHYDIVFKRAELFADSIIKAQEFSDWKTYLELSYPGAVKYYGGQDGYLQQVKLTATAFRDELEVPPSSFKIIQLENDMDEWQCVVERHSDRVINGKRSLLVTFFLGQSKDDGDNWKFFDLAGNAVENVIYIMPDVFTNLAIPERKIIAKN